MKNDSMIQSETTPRRAKLSLRKEAVRHLGVRTAIRTGAVCEGNSQIGGSCTQSCTQQTCGGSCGVSRPG
ncbi:MAG: hypothetical protein ACLQVI_38645 [Polyangiaceae bacterium]|jgi:hypothetical protein